MLTPLLSRDEIGRMARSQLERLYEELAIKACKLEQRVMELEVAAAKPAASPAERKDKSK
jgi:hypothetical protein